MTRTTRAKPGDVTEKDGRTGAIPPTPSRTRARTREDAAPLTDGQRSELIDAIGAGEDQQMACEMVGTTQAQLGREMARDPAFLEDVMRAEVAGDVVKTAADEAALATAEPQQVMRYRELLNHRSRRREQYLRYTEKRAAARDASSDGDSPAAPKLGEIEAARTLAHLADRLGMELVPKKPKPLAPEPRTPSKAETESARPLSAEELEQERTEEDERQRAESLAREFSAADRRAETEVAMQMRANSNSAAQFAPRPERRRFVLSAPRGFGPRRKW